MILALVLATGCSALDSARSRSQRRRHSSPGASDQSGGRAWRECRAPRAHAYAAVRVSSVTSSSKTERKSIIAFRRFSVS